MSEKREVYVFPTPGLGSVQHFHHFLYAMLVPLLDQWYTLTSRHRSARIFVQSCGPFDKVLKELNLPRIEIAPPDPALKRRVQKQIADGDQGVEIVLLKRHDYPRSYRGRVYRVARDLLSFRHADTINSHVEHINSRFKPGSPRILMIDRAKPDAFYASKHSEVKTAGSERRSIPNFAELAAALDEKFGNVLPVTLEGKTLLYQMALFSSVDLIVCQHGAALANLIWSRPGTRVIEIMPADIAENHAYNAFGRLTPCVDAEYWRLSQETSHSPVDAAALCALVAESLSGRIPGADLWPGFDREIKFSPNAPVNAWLGEGWLEPGQAGAWSVGPIATLRIPIPTVSTPAARLVAMVRPSLGAHRSRQDVGIIVNGVPVGTWSFKEGEDRVKRFVQFPAAVVNAAELARVEFHIADCRSPAELGLSKDDRELGINLHSLKIREITPPLHGQPDDVE